MAKPTISMKTIYRHRFSRALIGLSLVCTLAFMLCPMSAIAQSFTSRLTRLAVGEGVVTLHHDAEIDALVNGITPPSRQPRSNGQLTSQFVDSTATADSTLFTPTRRVRTIGYRIQVYAGGNNRTSKAEAYRMANLVRSEFPELTVYTHFISPRWICRAGDFKTNEEAREMLRRMRQTQKFREASIVKSQINTYQ